MATAQTLLDDLNDRLNDANNAAGAGEANKLRWLTHGLRAMWPSVYRTVVDTAEVTASGDFESPIAAGTGNYARVVRIDVETGASTGIYHILDDYDLLPQITSQVIRLRSTPAPAGAKLRVHTAVPLTALTANNTPYDGPPVTEELPVWYALGLALSRRIEDRSVHTRFSSTEAGYNGVDINELMNASQFAFAQFELMLDRLAMPMLPGMG